MDKYDKLAEAVGPEMAIILLQDQLPESFFLQLSFAQWGELGMLWLLAGDDLMAMRMKRMEELASSYEELMGIAGIEKDKEKKKTWLQKAVAAARTIGDYEDLSRLKYRSEEYQVDFDIPDSLIDLPVDFVECLKVTELLPGNARALRKLIAFSRNEQDLLVFTWEKIKDNEELFIPFAQRVNEMDNAFEIWDKLYHQSNLSEKTRMNIMKEMCESARVPVQLGECVKSGYRWELADLISARIKNMGGQYGEFKSFNCWMSWSYPFYNDYLDKLEEIASTLAQLDDIWGMRVKKDKSDPGAARILLKMREVPVTLKDAQDSYYGNDIAEEIVKTEIHKGTFSIDELNAIAQYPHGNNNIRKTAVEKLKKMLL